MKNDQKGITLIALIITIIVMLILVAVSVAIIIESDIIGTAEDAADKWEEADEGYNNLGTDNIIESGTYHSVQEYLDAVPGENTTGEEENTTE